MITISEIKEDGILSYLAEVRSRKHTLQAAVFSDRNKAERWAEWLEKRIGTDEMLKGLS